MPQACSKALVPTDHVVGPAPNPEEDEAPFLAFALLVRIFSVF